MKNAKTAFGLAVLLGGMLPSLASAGAQGTPEQDPVIANYRSRFAHAGFPKRSDLADKKFLCRARASYQDAYDEIELFLDFKPFGGNLILANEDRVTTFVPMNGSWIAAYPFESKPTTTNYFSVRMEDKGTLMLELSVDLTIVTTKSTPPRRKSSLSIAMQGPNIETVMYGVCLPYRPKSDQ